MERSNIPLLTCAILAALTTGGPTYAFGIYSVELKSTLHLSQTQLDTLSSAYFCAGMFTWIPGLLADRYGVRWAMSTGGVLGAVFMMAYWAVARQLVPPSDPSSVLAVLCTLGVLLHLANGLVIGATYKILVCTSTTRTKGSAVGLAKGYVGLGSGVYACLFQALRACLHDQSSLDFLPMASAMSLLACALPAVLLLPSRAETAQLWSLPKERIDKTTGRHFALVYSGLLALGILVLRTSVGELLEESAGMPPVWHTASSHITDGLLLLIFWLGPILGLRCLPERAAEPESGEEGYEDVEDCHKKLGDLHPGEQSPLLLDEKGSNHSLRTDSTLEDSFHRPSSNDADLPNNYSLQQLLQMPHAWCLLWIGMIMVGSGTMMTNNMGQMVESLGLVPETVVTPACMAIFSVAQAGSRVVTGAVSDAALERHRIPRPVFLIVAALLGALAHALLALTGDHQEGLFLLGVVLAGIAFGMIWPLMVLIVGEVFGTANMATNYLFYDGGACAGGTLLLSKFIAQEVYESHITDTEGSGDSTTCYGAECFQWCHWAVVLLALSCVAVGVPLLRKTKDIYSMVQH